VLLRFCNVVLGFSLLGTQNLGQQELGSVWGVLVTVRGLSPVTPVPKGCSSLCVGGFSSFTPPL
jgi:hypothetical protein